MSFFLFLIQIFLNFWLLVFFQILAGTENKDKELEWCNFERENNNSGDNCQLSKKIDVVMKKIQGFNVDGFF